MRSSTRKARHAAYGQKVKQGICPDCGRSTTADGQVNHAPTCPLFAALEAASHDDAAWFADHPTERHRYRKPTPAERTEARLLGLPAVADLTVSLMRRTDRQATFMRHSMPSGRVDWLVVSL